MRRVCKNCNKDFEVERVPSGKYSRRAFCCKECEQQYNKDHSSRKEHNCPICGKFFVYEKLPSGNYSKRICCSDECMKKYYEQKYGYSICKSCGKSFKRERTAYGGLDERLYCKDCVEKSKIAICNLCGKPYTKTRKYRGKYCNSCREREEYRYNHRICSSCGKEFEVPRLESGKLSGQQICSSCQEKAYEKAHYGKCVVCGKRFAYNLAPSGYISKNLFCSDECYQTQHKITAPLSIKKREETMLKKYGVTSSLQLQKVRKNKISKINKKFAEYLQENYGILVNRDEQGNIQEFSSGRYSYDLQIKDTNILLEINPTFSHTCYDTGVFAPREQYYHMYKTQYANDLGYHCINIWDWDNWDSVIKIVNPNKIKYYARKLQIKEITKQEANKFINENHLQGSCYGNSVNLGLILGSDIIQVMTFGKPRYNEEFQWELLRLCAKTDSLVIGGAERLFKYFLNNYDVTSIISYCDKSKFTGNVYERLGFKLNWKHKPSKIWSKDDRYITNKLLNQRGFDQLFGTNYGKGTNNEQLMLEDGWLPVYDCGQAKYVWKREERR